MNIIWTTKIDSWTTWGTYGNMVTGCDWWLIPKSPKIGLSNHTVHLNPLICHKFPIFSLWTPFGGRSIPHFQTTPNRKSWNIPHNQPPKNGNPRKIISNKVSKLPRCQDPGVSHDVVAVTSSAVHLSHRSGAHWHLGISKLAELKSSVLPVRNDFEMISRWI